MNADSDSAAKKGIVIFLNTVIIVGR
jgi:hypothetical protein